MRIALDARDLSHHPTGVGRYLVEIVRQWADMPEARAHEFIACAPSPVRVPGGERLNLTTAIAPGRGLTWEQWTLPRLVRESRADVLFAPGYSAPLLLRTPVVLTIHDVSYAAHPEWFRLKEGLRLRVTSGLSAWRAACVLTDSEFSRREIQAHFGVPDRRLRVIPLGVNRFDTMPPPADRDRSTPLVLYAGSIFNRRHIPELIDGFASMARRHPDARLVVVGENRTCPWLDTGPLPGRSPGRITLTSYATDADLASLYARARAFAFLSAYEGFGLTPLEALACEVPIVVLDTPVAREVYGDAAIYVARPEPALIDAALDRALFDETERRRVLDAAPAVLARYSWRACATQTLQALVDAAT